MALIPCPKCGQMISDKARQCPTCKTPATEFENLKKTVPITPPLLQQKNKSHKGAIIGIIAVLVILATTIGGWFYYNNIYLPKKIDEEAPRYYTMTNVNLRSSTQSGIEFNKLCELPYGTELITYEHDDEWSRIKVSPDNYGMEAEEGYVSSKYILPKSDFFLLNSIFGDSDSKDVIATSKCRKALLDYYKNHSYIGNLTAEEAMDADIWVTPDSDNQWQVFSKAKSAKYNTTYFSRLVNSNSKFTDFAVIIKNINTGDRKLLYFTFDDDETPEFFGEIEAPREGDIKKIKKNYWDELEVFYTDDNW